MLIDLHAILLLLVPVITLVALLVARRRSPTIGQLLTAVGVAVLAMALTAVFSQHACHEGVPLTQWLIPGLCLPFVLALVDSRPRRRLGAALLLVGMFGFSCHFGEVVHGHEWTGNPQWPGMGPIWLRATERFVDEEILAGDSGLASDPNAYPAGWLRETPFYTAIVEQMGDRVPARRVIHSAWHSRFTGLYCKTGVAQDFWYPGGPPAQGLRRLELRDRPQQPTFRPNAETPPG